MKLLIIVALVAVAVANPAKFPARATPSNPHARATPAKLPARATPANPPARATPSNPPARASPAKNPARASSDPVAILFSNSQMNADGSFSYEFETEDGIKVSQSGSQRQIGREPEEVGTVSQGSYSYTSPEGTFITVTWVADENGFQPAVSSQH